MSNNLERIEGELTERALAELSGNDRSPAGYGGGGYGGGGYGGGGYGEGLDKESGYGGGGYGSNTPTKDDRSEDDKTTKE